MASTFTYTDYTVGWISALPIELAAAQELLDEEHGDLPQIEDDDNVYSLGRIGEHNVVIAYLPAGQTGIASAATVAMQMRSTFRAIRFGLMVGIGGGVPSEEVDIRLGDVVVSQPGGGHGGVIQYDFGKTRPDKFERTGFLNTPPAFLLAAIAKLRASHDRGKGRFYDYVSNISKLSKFNRGNAGPDILYAGDGNEDSNKPCKEVKREVRAEDRSIIHYGTIASGNQVMRYGKERDEISNEFGGVLCFEMEAAGLMNRFPCLVIRGICDYADSFKDKRWQPHAAAVAAAYAKDLLSIVPQMAVKKSQTVVEATNNVSNNIAFGENNHGMQIGTSNAPIKFQADQNYSIKNSTVVLNNIHSQGGVTINSKTATSTDIIGLAQVSLRPVATYVARPSLYKQLKARLHNVLDVCGPSSKIVVVCGLGGAGKSQLVLHYIQTHRQDYSAVFWIEAGSRTTLERDYIQTWRLLSCSSEEKISVDDAIRGVKAWLHRQQENKRWLFIFDSADSIDDEAHKEYINLNNFMPDASCVDVIVTTRSQTAKDMTDIEEIQVGNLDAGEALELLLRCSKIRNAKEKQKQDAALIVKGLAHFALAVALAGAYIAATPRVRSHLELYLPEYQQRRKSLLGRKAQRQVHQYGESVLTTWETSYVAIASQCPEALGLFRLIAFLSADDIFYELFTPLLNRCSKTASIWSVTGAAMDPDGAVAQRRFTRLTRRQLHRPYEASSLDHSSSFGVVVARASAQCLIEVGDTLPPVDIWSQTWTEVFVPLSGDNLGALYSDQGKLGEAEKLYLRALEGREKALGADHTSTLTTAVCLANLRIDQMKINEGKALFKQVKQEYHRLNPSLQGYVDRLEQRLTKTVHNSDRRA